MKKLFSSAKAKLGLMAGAIALGTTNASAAAAKVYGQDVNVSTAEVLLIAGVVITGSAVIWGIRKSVALTNKS